MSRSPKKRIVAANRLRKEEEAKELRKGYAAIMSMKGGFSRSPVKGTIKRETFHNPRYTPGDVFVTQSENAHKPNNKRSVTDVDFVTPKDDREAKALEKTRSIKARIGQVGNKMGIQYLTDSDLADSKKGLLLRR